MLAKIFGAGALLLAAFLIVLVAAEYLSCQNILENIPVAQASVDRNREQPPKPVVPGALVVATDSGRGWLLQLEDAKNGNMFCKNK